MTRPAGEVENVRLFFDHGLPVARVARFSGIPRSTVRDWVRNGFVRQRPARDQPFGQACTFCSAIVNLPEEPYAYALGMYLGDGHISQLLRTYKLRITLDQRYPGIIEECKAALRALLPNRVGQYDKIGCVELTSHSQHWPCLLPQHGLGPKHLRPIQLEPWQKWVAVERHPRLLLRGLIHSDGSRFMNRVKTSSGTYEYPRYMFSNRSADIRGIFRLACERAGIECKPTNEWLIAVSKKADVALMDSFIGPKA